MSVLISTSIKDHASSSFKAQLTQVCFLCSGRVTNLPYRFAEGESALTGELRWLAEEGEIREALITCFFEDKEEAEDLRGMLAPVGGDHLSDCRCAVEAVRKSNRCIAARGDLLDHYSIDGKLFWKHGFETESNGELNDSLRKLLERLLRAKAEMEVRTHVSIS